MFMNELLMANVRAEQLQGLLWNVSALPIVAAEASVNEFSCTTCIQPKRLTLVNTIANICCKLASERD